MFFHGTKRDHLYIFLEIYILDWLDVQPGFHDAMDMSMRIRMLITVTIEAMTKDQVNISKGMIRA